MFMGKDNQIHNLLFVSQMPLLPIQILYLKDAYNMSKFSIPV